MKLPATLLALFTLLSSGCQSPPARQAGTTDSTSAHREDPLPRDSLPAIVPHPDREEAWFAFADSTGSRLICRNPDSLAAGPYFVATSEGTFRSLRSLGKQVADTAWNHRATAREFDRMGGHVFALEGPSLEPDQTYLVATGTFVSSHRPLPLEFMACQGLAAQAKDIQPFQSTRGIRDAWVLVHTPRGNIGTLVYQGKPPLAGLFLARGDSSAIERFPGTIGEDSSSVWRVDDGGVFGGCGFRILAMFQTTKGLELAYSWPAFEGEASVLMRQAADTFQVLRTDSRYWSP